MSDATLLSDLGRAEEDGYRRGYAQGYAAAFEDAHTRHYSPATMGTFLDGALSAWRDRRTQTWAPPRVSASTTKGGRK